MEEQQKEDKYYTPTIEEFYQGFEFESYWISGLLIKGKEETGWSKEKYDWDWSSTVNDDWEHENETFNLRYRVKYLNQEDINNLFKDEYCFKWEDDTDFEWVKGGLLYKGIFTKTDSMISFYSDGWDECVFRGTIKNKSELKVLLRQLNITCTQ